MPPDYLGLVCKPVGNLHRELDGLSGSGEGWANQLLQSERLEPWVSAGCLSRAQAGCK